MHASRTGRTLGVLYALALGSSAGALWAVGLPEMAAALLVIELLMTAMIVAVRRTPARPRRLPPR